MRLTTQSLKKQLQFQGHDEPTQPALLPRLLLAWIAGAIFVFALAPYHIWGIALLSPVILYALLVRPLSNWQAFWLGEMYGMGLWSVGAFWLYTSIHTYGDTPAVMAVGMIGLLGLIMGLFHGILAWLFNRFFGKQPLSFASLWVVQEWLKTWLFTGFPWLFVGYAYADYEALTSFAPIFGVLAISFLSVFISASLVEIYRQKFHFAILSTVLLLISVFISLINPNWTQPKNTPNLQISLVQGNIPQDLKWLVDYQQETLGIYQNLSRSEWGRDLVVWPEAAIPMFQTEVLPFINTTAKVAKDNNTAWVTGIPYIDVEAYDPKNDRYPPFYNSIVAFGKDSVGLYKKQNLVPVGEYMPLEGMLNSILPQLMSGAYSFRSGDSHQAPLTVKNHKVGMAVCYEVAYPDTTRKNAVNSDFLLSVSNEAWFNKTNELAQHLQMVQMRSIETGRWFVRATNTGMTAIIDHHGKVVAHAQPDERTVLRGEVQARTGITPFMRWGNYPVLILTAFLLVISWLTRRFR